MKLLFMIGNAAVGKMTVGQELMKLTGLRLFHNHMTIEPVIEIFGQYNGKQLTDFVRWFLRNLRSQIAME
jgi:shikimate kinase